MNPRCVSGESGNLIVLISHNSYRVNGIDNREKSHAPIILIVVGFFSLILIIGFLDVFVAWLG